jgi:uncharacterized membrane protein YdjX (TVP38/TMEM64 family)
MLNTRRAVYLLVGLAFVVTVLVLFSRFGPIIDFVEASEQAVMRWGTWSVICYPLLFALCNLLLLPGGLLSVGGGFFFGLWRGFLLALIGNQMAAAISFALSRLVWRRWFNQRFARSRILQLLGPAVEREGWKIIALSQLHPLFPTSLLNYFYGLTRIRFATCMVWTTVGRIPGLFVYVYLGTVGKVGFDVARGAHRAHAAEYWLLVTAFGIAVLLVVLLARMAVRAVRLPGQAREIATQPDSRRFITHNTLG